MLSSMVKHAQRALQKHQLDRRGIAALGALALCASTVFGMPVQALALTPGSQYYGFGPKQPASSGAADSAPSGPSSDPAPGTAYSSDLKDFVTDVTIKDKDGNPVEDTLYVGEDYTIHIGFTEKGATGLQFDTADGTLTYQIPKNFKVEKVDEGIELKVQFNGQQITLGTYTIDENGLLTITLSEEGKNAIEASPDIELAFDMQATAAAVEGGTDQDVSFGDAGQDFNFKVTDQARLNVEKYGKYNENAAKTGGVLDYTVTTVVEHGSVHDVELDDTFTPPQTDAFDLKMGEKDGQPAVTVTLKIANTGETVTLGPKDYELKVKENPDPNNPEKKAFEIKLKEGSPYRTLHEGDELQVTYQYNVQYVTGATDTFWGNAVNEITVNGMMTVPNPDGEGTNDVPVTETRGSEVEIYATPVGHGVVSKDEAYSEATKTLHYTCYTVVPKGEWAPLFVQDDMYVEYGGQRWYLNEFRDGGRVKNLKVSAVDVDHWFDDWDKSDEYQKLYDLQSLKDQAKPLQEFAFSYETIPGYDLDNIDQYVRRNGGTTLNIIFGFDPKTADSTLGSKWGRWDYNKDRLIITEYDLDMSDGELALISMQDWTTEKILSASEILLAGIKNNVNLRYSSYNPGYSVFFNNAEKMNKTGKLDKNTNTIEYTVTMNTTDTTVNKYFRDVKDEWLALNASDRYHWVIDKAYPESMQAVFYDVLPEGWEYVEGSLGATVRNDWGGESYYPYDDKGFYTPVTEDGGKQVIKAPLMFFYNREPQFGNYDLFNCFSRSMIKLTFTYKLKATDEWVAAHATAENDIEIHNYAAIKDKDRTHWEANATNPYYPARLTKVAKQVGDTNLLEFTLQVNPNAIDLDGETSYLIVTDTSQNLLIQPETIKVVDKDGNELTCVGQVTSGQDLTEDQWGLLSAGEQTPEGAQFQLAVPDGKALTVTYQALIPKKGTDIPVSNKAAINGVSRSDSSYAGSLVVNKIAASGGGSKNALPIQKVSSEDAATALAGAEFDYYIVPEDDNTTLTPTKTFTVQGEGEKEYTYPAYSEGGWHFTTGEDGTYKISNSRIAPGNYYLLVETKAPEGYALLQDPILIYFGFEAEKTEHPEAVTVLPGNSVPLQIKNTPVHTVTLPDAGGPGTTGIYLLGGLLVLTGAVPLLRRRKKGAKAG